MSRYTVGKKEYFIRVVFERPEPILFPLYLPGHDKLKEIQIISLMCVEHHKVYNDYDDRTQLPQHDGYIFKDLETRQIFHNQYPTASFGQLDDSQNYVVRPNDNIQTFYVDLESHVDNIMRGLRSNRTNLNDEVKFTHALRDHLNEIIEALFQQHNALLVFRPRVVRYTKESGKQPSIISDWLTASVEELKETD